MKRSAYWDSLKFILIILVVYAHAISPYRHDSQFNTAIYNFVYLFHMPLFIFISGRFSQIRNKERYKFRTIKILETYIVFQILFTILLMLSGKSLSIASITKPFWVFWYLLSLVNWRLMVYYIPRRWIQHRTIVLLISICISLIVGYMPIGHHFAIHRTLSFLPFFVMGYYSADIKFHQPINKIPSYLAVGILIAFSIVTYITPKFGYALILYNTYTDWYQSHAYALTTFPIIRCLFICIAIILSIMVLRLVRPYSHLAKWGERTLFIFVYHTFALKLLFQLINRNYLPQNELLFVVYTAIIIIGLIFLTRYSVLYVMRNPFTHYLTSRARPPKQQNNSENLNN